MANVALLATIADAKASQATQTVSPVMPTGVILPYGGNTAPEGWLVCDGAEYSQTTYADLFAALGSTYNTQLNPVTGSNWAAPSGGNFRVPDMRGMFMRGEGTPSGLDAVSVGGSQVQKTKPNGLTNSTSTAAAQTGTAAAQTLNTSAVSVSGAKNQMNGGTGGMSANTNPGHSYSLGANLVANAFGSGGNSVAQYQGTGGLGAATVNSHAIEHSHGWDFGAATFSASGSLSSLTLNSSSVSLSSSSVTAQTISGDNETRPINRGVKYIIKV